MTFDQIPLDAQFVSQRGERFARITRTDRAQVLRRSFAFGVFDAKGREIGHSYAIDREFWIVDGHSEWLCQIDKLEDHLDETFIVYPHALRDGRAFGALPTASYKRFRTEGEAIRYGDKLVEQARKRAAKKARV